MEKKVKVLLALPLPPPYSGVETFTQFFLQCNLREIFDFIHIDTSNKRSNEFRGKIDIPNLVRSVRTVIRIAYALIRNLPEIANVPIAKNKFGFLRDGIIILICSLFGAKVVTRMTGDHFSEFYNEQNHLMRQFIRIVLKRTSKIVVRANRIRAQFDGLYPQSKIEVVYLPFDPEFFRDVEQVSKLSESDGIIRVLYVGHITKAKGAFDLLSAVPKVLAKNNNVKFIFAGNLFRNEYNVTHVGNLHRMDIVFQKYLERYSDHIEFKGIVQSIEKRFLFKTADLLVLPSYSESFSYVVLEAMAAELPVVATPVGALPEVFEDRKNILFVPTDDSDALAAAINELVQSRRLRVEMGRLNRLTVRDRFDLETFSQRMAAIYNDVHEYS